MAKRLTKKERLEQEAKWNDIVADTIEEMKIENKYKKLTEVK